MQKEANKHTDNKWKQKSLSEFREFPISTFNQEAVQLKAILDKYDSDTRNIEVDDLHQPEEILILQGVHLSRADTTWLSVWLLPTW